MPDTYRILLVEDDTVIAETLAKHLTSWGYYVQVAEDFTDVMPAFSACNPHLVLLDIGLPFYNGYHWCRMIRRVSQVPVVFLSSMADNMSIIVAMNEGGDDFIPKPVDLAVLTAKLQAILRRAYDLSGSLPVLEHGGAVLHLAEHSVMVHGDKQELTKNEFCILQTLMQSHGRVISRNTLMNALWQDDCYVEENTLTVNVARLRKKLEAMGLSDYIVTKAGSGYMVP